MAARRWTVSGRVQGVGFRWFVLRRAEALRLRGWVRNLPDGRVEVVAAGPAESLDVLETALRAGPGLAQVLGVETTSYQHEVDIGNSFEIR
jgi:acylphosphatase